MTLATQILSVSASNIDTFEDCRARFYHEKKGTDRLPTDSIAANVGSAIHDALMEYHRQTEWFYRRGTLATSPIGPERLRFLVDRCLRQKRLDKAAAPVAKRLAELARGLDLVASLVVSDMPRWAVDPRTGDPLVWAEQKLDHGPAIPAVDFGPGFLVSTRPDVIGLRPLPTGEYRAVVRDFKTRSEVTHPAFDFGALVRGIWVIQELGDPRCSWFMAGRRLPLDRTGVDLETVNLAFADSSDFLLSASLDVDRLLEWRATLRGIVAEMGDTLGLANVDDVLASPKGLCYQYCPFLHRCGPGQAHVRKSKGADALVVRLGTR